MASPCFAQSQADHGSEVEPIVVVVEPATACVSASDFLARIQRRTAQATLAAPGVPARRFVLTLEEGQQVVGVLSIAGRGDPGARRQVQGHTCAEVVEALALVAAVAIDPQAALRAEVEQESRGTEATGAGSAVGGEAAPLPANDARKKVAPESADRVRSGEVDHPTPATVVVRQGRPESQTTRWQYGVGLLAGVITGIGDGVAVGAGARLWAARDVGASWILPLLMLGGHYTPNIERRLDDDLPLPSSATLQYQLAAAQVGICPAGRQWRDSLRLSLCGLGQLGSLRVKGIGFPGADVVDRGAYATLGLEAFYEVRITHPLWMVGSLGWTVPLVSHTVKVRPATVVDKVRSPAFFGSLGLAWQWAQ